MGAVATFDYASWSAAYPEFSNVASGQAQAYWNEATILHRNDGGGPVQDVTMQTSLLNLLTAHIAFLRVGTAANQSAASQGLSGRVTSATQGSVSLSTELPGLGPNSAWCAASAYGYSYWNYMAPYRTMHYRARRDSHHLPF